MALSGWLLLNRAVPSLWPLAPSIELPRGWREFGWAMLGAAGVIAIGQLWSRGIRLPESSSLLGAVNQLLIFAPILLVPAWRRHAPDTAWLPRPRLALRLSAGLALSVVAIAAYSWARHGSAPPWLLLARIWQPRHVDELVQVLCEDVAIAIVFVRLASAIGSRGATIAVACLFAAGHIPAMLSSGASWPETAGLLRDAALGTAVILVLQRSRDVTWFWLVHFSMDMLQFDRVSGAS